MMYCKRKCYCLRLFEHGLHQDLQIKETIAAYSDKLTTELKENSSQEYILANNVTATAFLTLEMLQ